MSDRGFGVGGLVPDLETECSGTYTGNRGLGADTTDKYPVLWWRMSQPDTASINIRSRSLTTGETSSQAIPITAESAPRFWLATATGTNSESSIECRRVVTMIGSRSGCKVNVPHPKVAPVHVAIVNDGTRILAIDLVTTTGTLLNGLKLEHECLSDGDVLKIHAWEFRVKIQMPPRSGTGDAESLGMDTSLNVMALQELPTGRVLKLGRDLCTIGRRHGCDIVISDDKVSRTHALLLTYFGYPAILDLLSGTRTFVNNDPVGFRHLRDDDVITIGGSTFRVRLVGSAAVERAARDPRTAGKSVDLRVDEVPPDLVDIQTAESKHRWRIVDDADNSTRKQ